MSSHATRFQPRSAADVVQLIRQYPLAWAVSGAGCEFAATLLPLFPVVGSDGRVTELRGHFARSNPQLDGLRRTPRMNALFLGPHGYVSPSWLADRSQAPTWVYASARFELDLDFIEGSELDEVIGHLVDAMEQGRPQAWRVSEMGSRYRKLVQHVVGFRGRVLSQDVKLKLGQDERGDVFCDIMRTMADNDPELFEWMRSCNPGRSD